MLNASSPFSLPTIAIVVPVFNYAPKLYLWFIRERVRRLYRRLRLMDKELTTELSPSATRAIQVELDSIARAAAVVPMRNSELFFGLVTHIDRTRTQLDQRLPVEAAHVSRK